MEMHNTTYYFISNSVPIYEMCKLLWGCNSFIIKINIRLFSKYFFQSVAIFYSSALLSCIKNMWMICILSKDFITYWILEITFGKKNWRSASWPSYAESVRCCPTSGHLFESGRGSFCAILE